MSEPGIIKLSDSTEATALIHIGGRTIEVNAETAKDISTRIHRIAQSEDPASVSYTIRGDLCDVVLLFGPSTPVIIEFAAGTAPL
ncbi:hypothetical protein G8767_17250 [Rhodococcus sp. IC4_135]|uniref:hypothetical protein n=1 Tax=Rhodococcus sp. IC4_135 TaxID=2715537 RepID=UPI00141EC7F1|nr:hypothetical protein [Rhodococcus sp. IC4_135]